MTAGADTRNSGVPLDMPAIRTELGRLLADPDFACSQARRRMLAYLVEETLAGRGDRLKGPVLAQEVFDRGADFDPQSDPVVRIEARRLRRDLDVYYASYASRADLRFSIPKGAYAASFLTQPHPVLTPEETAPPPADIPSDTAPKLPDRTPANRRRLMIAIAASVVAAAILFARFWPMAYQPTANASAVPALAVARFVSVGANRDGDYLSLAISDQLVNELMMFRRFRVFALPNDRSDLSEDNLTALQDKYGIRHVVSGTLLGADNGDLIRIIVQLRDMQGEIIWSGSFDRLPNAQSMFELEDELSKTIATTLSQTYGVIASDMSRAVDRSTYPSDSSFSCMLRAHAYRRGFDPKLRDSVTDCLQAAVRRDPQNAEIHAMRGWLELDQSRFPDIDAVRRNAHRETAFEMTSRAVELEPRNITALEAHAAVLHNRGDYAEAEEILRKAVAMNPEDPEILHQLGWRLAVRGQLEEGVSYIRQAIDRSVDPPARYFNLIAIGDFVQGRYAEMLRSARISAAGGSSVGNALLAIALAETNGHPDQEVAQALKRMGQLRPELERDPAAVFRRHGVTDELVGKLVAGLENAGWTSPHPAE
ncbi:tetratricopeptide repeat protein [Paracoccus sp. Z330]|uniref:Tetratricopeptide repeat protein n=1 Tax=Paracoccus onchidii TaxID=3017813 RepID=A0ABT4ZJP6_9RHOB|nr:tetratricopeptide repeat protein [Paracoccus onchidii]MDB6179593.1 tetratricopeptide repeat protein [Paracoccus onchidii]